MSYQTASDCQRSGATWNAEIAEELKKEWLNSREDRVIKVLTNTAVHHMSTGDFSTVLEVGGGAGHNNIFLKERGIKFNYIDIDISPEMLIRARDLNPSEEFLLGDGTRLPFKSSTIDVVLCSDVLVHCLDYRTLLKELYRVTKKMLIIRAVVRLEGETVDDIKKAYQKKGDSVFPYIVINYAELYKALLNMKSKKLFLEGFYRRYGKMDKYTFTENKPKDISILVAVAYKGDTGTTIVKGGIKKPMRYRIMDLLGFNNL